MCVNMIMIDAMKYLEEDSKSKQDIATQTKHVVLNTSHFHITITPYRLNIHYCAI